MRTWARRTLEPLITDLFHRVYYNKGNTWDGNTFLGYPVLQSPFDLYLYQELVTRLRPRCIIQTGVAQGGSVLYFASLLDLLHADSGSLVIGIDLHLSDRAKTVTHSRVRLLEGSSTSPEILRAVRELVPPGGAMVSLDSDHSCDHVLAELNAYGDFVGAGSYLVVEDMNINGHPVGRTFGPGPFEAVEEFLQTDTRFVRDDALWKRNLLSFHHHGWLKRRD